MRLTRTSSFDGLPDLVAELGGDISAMAEEIGLEPEHLARPDLWAPAISVPALLNLAAVRLNRPDLGLRWGQRTPTTLLGPLYVAMAHSRSLREAIATGARFLHTQTQQLRVEIVKDSPSRERVVLFNHVGARRGLDLLVERQITFLLRLLGDLAERPIVPIEILFDHAPKVREADYERALGVAPRFEAGADGIVFSSKDLSHRIANASPLVREMAHAHLMRTSGADAASFPERVADVVRALLASEDCNSRDVARVLGMDTRTLQRRLIAAGTTFESIKDQARRNLAEQLLASDMPLIQITLTLHYANASAFSRSAKRWFGMSPTQYRAALREVGRH